ncbi:MAG: Transcriptional regulator, IclR family [Hyphomicrobiales bacterium]|nr:Transcriptional regulator, IclR family [Hyphomicrobiales bacterium]
MARAEGAGGIRSLEKGAGVLRHMRAAGGPLRLTEIARLAGMSRSMAHGYLVSLVRAGLVAQDPDSGRYDLGEDALQLGLAALTRVDFMKLGRETLESLAADIGETVLLSVWSDGGPVCVAKIDGKRRSLYEVRVGGVANLLVTSTGLAFLAYKPAGSCRDLIERARDRGLGAGLDDVKLEAVFERIRRAGLSATQPAMLPEASSIAAPVFGQSNDMRAALTVIGPTGALDISPEGVNAAALLQAAGRLSRRLGAQPGGLAPGGVAHAPS